MERLTHRPDLAAMIQQQIIDRGITDEAVLSAMAAVDRGQFFSPQDGDSPFADRASPIGQGQTISQPYIVALMSASLQLKPGQRVLEIGTGSGYQTAILSTMGAEVYTIERIKPLLDPAFERLQAMGLRNIHFRFGDGTLGWPEAAPFDRMIISAAAPHLPSKLLLAQLAPQGMAVLPVGRDESQVLVKVQRRDDQLLTTEICPVRFVRLIGQEAWAP